MQERLMNAGVGVLVLCAVVVTGLVVRREMGASEAAPPSQLVAGWREYASRGQRTGPASAPVTVVEFSDFQCPACRVLAERLRTLRREDPSKFAVVFRHFPLPNHALAEPAARASECAAAQGRFEPFHDAVFAAQESLSDAAWPELATRSGVPDLAAFERCVATGESARVREDISAGMRLGLRVTPTLLINGERVNGAPSLETLRRMIDEAAR